MPLSSVASRVLPRQRRQAVARASVSALVASLPLLYVSLLRPPPSPAALAADSAFWFLMSNCVVAAIVAADDTLCLFGPPSNKHQEDHDEDGGGGDPTPVVLPLAAEAAAVSAEELVGGGRVQDQEVPPAGTMAATGSDDSMDVAHALPSLIKGEEEEDGAASKPIASADNPVQRGEEEGDEGQEVSSASLEVPAVEKEGDAVLLEAIGGGEDVANTTFAAGGELVSTDAGLAIIEEDDYSAPAEPGGPEPWPRLLTGEGLVKEEEEAAAHEEWVRALCSRTPSAPPAGQDKGGEGRLRRWATEGSKPAAAPAGDGGSQSQYWELSDEELNRRVEEFIARFNREMRLQIEQEAAAG